MEKFLGVIMESNCLPIPSVVSTIWHGTWCHQVVSLLAPVNMGHCSSPMQRCSLNFTKTINEEHKHQTFCSFCMGACVYLDNIWDPLWWISHASVRSGGEKPQSRSKINLLVHLCYFDTPQLVQRLEWVLSKYKLRHICPKIWVLT